MKAFQCHGPLTSSQLMKFALSEYGIIDDDDSRAKAYLSKEDVRYATRELDELSGFSDSKVSDFRQFRIGWNVRFIY